MTGTGSLANDHDFMHPGQLHAPGYCTSCDRKRDEVAVSRDDLREFFARLGTQFLSADTRGGQAEARLRAAMEAKPS